MSWIDKVTKEKLSIITGDGEYYEPLFKTAKRSRDLNAVPVEFNDTLGSYVLKGEASHNEYAFELYFQGEDHLEVAEKFEASLLDLRPWVVSHPYFKGELLLQPTKYERDNNFDNVSQFNITIYETIDLYTNRVNSDSALVVRESIDKTGNTISSNATKIDASETDKASISSSNNKVFGKLKVLAKLDSELEELDNKIAKAQTYLNTLGDDPVRYMTQVAEIFRTPAKFYNTITQRIGVFTDAFENLKLSMIGVGNLAMKQTFEYHGGLLLSGIAESAITTKAEIAKDLDIEDNTNDYNTKSQVLSIINSVNSVYEDYIYTLGTIQSELDNKLDSYYPDPSNLLATKNMIRSVTSNLFSIAYGAKQEKVYTLTEDMPLVLICSKLKWDINDLPNFIAINNISTEEMTLLKTGRKITYYV